jgi:hypothetical protein
MTSSLNGSRWGDVVEELDCGGLVEAGVDPQDPQPGAVIDRGELVVLAA